MSMPGSDTIGGSAHSNSGGRKREACDRCHGQKLRCIFHNQGQDSSDTRCVRCAKAGASCTTGVSGRVGRPRVSNSSTFEEQRGRGRGNRRRPKDRTVSRVTFSADVHRACIDRNAEGWQKTLEQNTLDRENGCNIEGLASVHAANSLPEHDTSDALRRADFQFSAPLWSEETMPQFFDDDVGEALDFMPPGLEYDWPPHGFQAPPVESQTLSASPACGVSRFAGVNADVHGTPNPGRSTNINLSEASHEATGIDIQNESRCRGPTSSIKISDNQHSHPPNRSTKEEAVSLNAVMDSTTDLNPLMNVVQEKTDTELNEETQCAIQHGRIQKLSHFAMDLYEQVISINSNNNQPVSTVTTAALRDQLVGSVLRSSITFSKLLDSFSTSTNFSAPSSTSSPTNSASSINRSYLNSSPSESGTSTSPSAQSSERPATNELIYHPHSNISASYFNASKQPPPIDVTAVLQLVICYIRIIHLHSNMYRRILDFLVACPFRSAQQVLPVFPGMQVGGVSLDTFGMFQIKLLVQISVHVLGGIETALGLPERYRVGKRKNGGNRLLESNLSGRFVECLMKDEAWSSQNIECVRKHLKNLGEVLEGAIEM